MDEIEEIIRQLMNIQEVKELAERIDRTLIRVRPVEISDSGYKREESVTRTQDGLINQVEEPLILVGNGQRVEPLEIGGKCAICGKYTSKEHTFFCHALGCGKLLCLECVYFYEEEDKHIPYCYKHYRQKVAKTDEWLRLEKAIAKRRTL